MGMNFDSMVLSLENEILALKEARIKSASTLKTQRKAFNVTFDYEYYQSPWGGGWGRCKKWAVITLQTASATPLTMVMVDYSSTPSISTYPIFLNKGYNSTTGNMLYYFRGYDYDSDDVSKLSAGKAVSKTYKMIAVATCDFDVTVSYEDLWGD